MSYKITFSDKFKKHYKALNSNEQKQLQNKIKLLTENPLHPSLRVKKIQGTKDIFEFSVNMNVRVIWYFEGDVLILLLDVGHHDILNQY